jgi:hypothetical protein
MTDRTFSFDPAVRERVPLLIGLCGPSGSGKTYSALRLAQGMAKINPGPILFIDTENRRGLHYAENFSFKHADFGAPFGSLDYLEAMREADRLKPSVIVVDSMSHEHEGPGGLVDMQDKEMQRLAGEDYGTWKAERFNMIAWQKPKAARRLLLQGITRLNANVILCFRAGEKSKPQKNAKGKTEIVEQGFTPIAGSEFVYEMTLCALLRAGARGVPTWDSDKPGEHAAIKLPGQFRDLFEGGGPITEQHGEALAKWAMGGAEPSKRASNIDIGALHVAGEAAARKGSYALKAWWTHLDKAEQKLLFAKKDEDWKPLAEAADKQAEALQPATMEEIPF